MKNKKIMLNKEEAMEHDEILDDPGLVALWEAFRLGIGP